MSLTNLRRIDNLGLSVIIEMNSCNAVMNVRNSYMHILNLELFARTYSPNVTTPSGPSTVQY